jgi:hypothetical protein
MRCSTVTAKSMASTSRPKKRPGALVPAVVPAPGQELGLVDLDVRVQPGEDGGDVPPREGLVDLPDDADAVSRHRATPRSSRERHASLLPVVEEALQADVGQRVLEELLEDGERQRRHVGAGERRVDDVQRAAE